MAELKACVYCGAWLFGEKHLECRSCKTPGCAKCIPELSPLNPTGGYCLDCQADIAKEQRKEDGISKP